MLKTIIGIGCGAILSGIAIAGVYFDPQHTHSTVWVILSLVSWVILAWGAGEFAKHRGYSGAVGYSLMALGLFMELFFVFRSHNPWIFVLGFIYVASFPIAILLALPQKYGHPNRSKKRRK